MHQAVVARGVLSRGVFNSYGRPLVVIATIALATGGRPSSVLAEALNQSDQEPVSAQPSSPVPSGPLYIAEYSSVPMWRNAMISDVAWNLLDRGADVSLDVVTQDRFTRKSIRWCVWSSSRSDWHVVPTRRGSLGAGRCARRQSAGT